MPAKKKTTAKAADDTAPPATPEVKAPTATPPQRSDVVGGVTIGPKELETLNQPIDDRMAALLKDHQAMGARPK